MARTPRVPCPRCKWHGNGIEKITIAKGVPLSSRERACILCLGKRHVRQELYTTYLLIDPGKDENNVWLASGNEGNNITLAALAVQREMRRKPR